MAQLEDWTPERVKLALDEEKIVLIDVRTPAEYMMEHVNGALLMPMAFFRVDALPVQNGKRIVLHCGSGARSSKVAKEIIKSGVSPLAHMDGGFAAWKKAGLPYTGTDMASGAPKEMIDE